MVAAGARFNRADDIPAGDNTYGVTVTATDGDGQSEMIAVDITVVKVDEPPSISRVDDTTGMVVAPTEMSHWESRRNDPGTDYLESPALQIDTDLDTAVATIEAATYMAMDPEDGEDNLTWSLEGDDGWLFYITPGDATNTTPAMATATLSFKTYAQLEATHPNSQVLEDYPNFPDFENERDANKDNVYKVTIVVTDSTLVNRDELDVTVKVIDSTEDNRPGKVLISNRQPEGASVLTATLVDADQPIKNLRWQWYRSVDGSSTDPEECGTVSATNVFTPDNTLGTVPGGVFAPTFGDTPAWEIITGATSDTYTPKWDEDATGPQDDAGRCLMARATYTDLDAADPTMADDPGTVDVDESDDEKAYGVSEHPVQVEDEDNSKPQFRVNPGSPSSDPTDSYLVTVPENGGAVNIGIEVDTDNDGTNDVFDAVVAAIDDEGVDEDGNPQTDNDREPSAAGTPGDDILTYTLSGPDAKYFQITGSITMPVADEDNAGQLMTRDSLDFEKDKQYQLTLRATDPSGKWDESTVNVTVTNGNDPLKLKGKDSRHYMEDRTSVIETYTATDEDPGGITYTIVPGLGDHEVFTINSLTGTLTFKPRSDGKARPNYELPEDVEITGNTEPAFNSDPVNNLYIVAVRARITGTSLPGDPEILATTNNPRASRRPRTGRSHKFR